MDKELILSIQLDESDYSDSSKYYAPKEEVKGQVLVFTKRVLEIESLTLMLIGTGSVHRSRPGNKSRQSISTFKTENYLNERIFLAGGVFTEDTETPTSLLSPKTHIYSFLFILPHGTPSSFKASNCSVDYFLEAKLRFPQTSSFCKLNNQCNEIINKTIIQVKGCVDLNDTPGITEEAEGYNHKNITYCLCSCCIRSLVDANLSVSRRGYVPGEIISFSFQVANQSGRRIVKMITKLVQTIFLYPLETNKCYSKNSKVIVETKELGSGNDISKINEGIWNGTLQIPTDIPISRLGGSKIIDVQYGLQGHVILKGCISRKVQVEIPIVIGTIPLRKPLSFYNEKDSGEADGFNNEEIDRKQSGPS